MLALQKERSQASRLLVNAIKKETKRNPKAIKDLLQALENISTSFQSDKAQQIFELGVSLRSSDPKISLLKLNEALALEPDNQAIILELNRLLISLNECQNAIENLKKIKEIYPFSDSIELTLSQAAICAGQFEIYKQFRVKSEDKKGMYYLFWNIVELEYQYKTGHFQKAKEISFAIQNLKPVFPESYYWDWKISVETKINPDVAGAKYLSSCKNLSNRIQRELSIEPNLCKRTSEIETYSKKINNQNQ